MLQTSEIVVAILRAMNADFRPQIEPPIVFRT